MRRFFLPGWVNLLRTVLRFPSRANTLSCSRSSSICAATVIPASGICERQIQEHKREGWQDWLAPVLVAMHRFPDSRATACAVRTSEDVENIALAPTPPQSKDISTTHRPPKRTATAGREGKSDIPSRLRAVARPHRRAGEVSSETAASSATAKFEADRTSSTQTALSLRKANVHRALRTGIDLPDRDDARFEWSCHSKAHANPAATPTGKKLSTPRL